MATTVALVGCGDDGGGVDGSTDGSVSDAEMPTPDGEVDAAPEGKPCDDDPDCDDGIPCTRDICTGVGVCDHVPDHGMCQDDSFCNGMERCDEELGCITSSPRSCSDGDVCTISTCNEEEKTCDHAPRDLDEDGEADWHCPGGTDCDDMDPRRGSSMSEICTDGIDNDCDGEIDESDCVSPEHDRCDDPLDVSAGGSFMLRTEGAGSDYVLSCGGTGRKDVTLTFTLDEPQDIRIRAEGTSVTWLELRGECDDDASILECRSGFPAELRARALEPGTYYGIVKDAGSGDLGLDVELTEPTEPPENETCDAPEDVSEGGSYDASLVDVEDDLSVSCGATAVGDLVYELTLDERKNVDIALTADSGTTMAFEVRSSCADPDTALRCVRGAPAGGTMYDLAPGSYAIIIEAASSREVDFTLEVDLSDPTPPPDGDTCGTAIDLPLGEETLGSLSDKQDDIDVSCGFFYRDAVYSFELEERSDVTVEVDGGGSFMTMSVREECSDTDTELRCTSGAPARARMRNLPAATYYVVAESVSGTGFNITAEASAPTVATEVSDNDTCDTAYEVPSSGGLFTGDTSSMSDHLQTEMCGGMAESNDAVFELDLAAEKHVVASTEGSAFDTVLHVHKDACESGFERYCDDDGGESLTSVIDRNLGAGTWYFVVDGFGAGSDGEYTFELTLSDP